MPLNNGLKNSKSLKCPLNAVTIGNTDRQRFLDYLMVEDLENGNMFIEHRFIQETWDEKPTIKTVNRRTQPQCIEIDQGHFEFRYREICTQEAWQRKLARIWVIRYAVIQQRSFWWHVSFALTVFFLMSIMGVWFLASDTYIEKVISDNNAGMISTILSAFAGISTSAIFSLQKRILRGEKYEETDMIVQVGDWQKMNEFEEAGDWITAKGDKNM
jgi:hypothetical protein